MHWQEDDITAGRVDMWVWYSVLTVAGDYIAEINHQRETKKALAIIQ